MAVHGVDKEVRVLARLRVPDLDAVHVVVGQEDGPELLRVGDDDAALVGARLLDELRGPVEVAERELLLDHGLDRAQEDLGLVHQPVVVDARSSSKSRAGACFHARRGLRDSFSYQELSHLAQ